MSLTYDEGAGTGKTNAQTDTHHGRFVKLVPDQSVIQETEFETSDPAMIARIDVSIHARARGATTSGRAILARQRVSIHAPARGATAAWDAQRLRLDEFLSTPPREGRLRDDATRSSP